MPKRRRGSGLAVWGTGREPGPILARCNEQTARMLGVPLDQLQALVADLEPVTQHASGEPVWRVADLLQQLGRLPEPADSPSRRGGLAAQRRAKQAGGGA